MAQDWRNRSRSPYDDEERSWSGRAGTWDGENWAGGTEYPDEQRTFNRGNFGPPGAPRFGPSFNRGGDWRGTEWPDYGATWRGDRDYGYGYGMRGDRDYPQRREAWTNQRDRGQWDRPYGNRASRQEQAYGGSDWRDDSGRHERNFWDKASDEVSSWFGDDDASRRRRMDEERGAHRGRGPKGYTRSDDRIREDVSDALSDDPYVDAREIEVTVVQGEVTLTGTVDNRFAKRRAEDSVDNISGVRHVQNNLRVRDYAGSGMATGTGASGQTSSAATSVGMSVRNSDQKV